jgi:STE24 endopeptidase
VANEDKAARYHRLRRRASLAGTAASALFFLVLFFSGGSAAVRDAIAPLAGGSFVLLVIAYVVILAGAHELLQLPLAFYQGVTLERRYQLSRQTTAGWWKDQLKAWALGLGLALGAALVIWALLRWSPQWWWLLAGVVFAGLLVVLAQIAPVVFLPLFYDCTPLDRPALTARLIALAERARTPVLGVFEWRLGDRTRKANAALAGIGATRRILLSDTLLAEHSDDEIEVILAHELAHHVHGDIWSGIALESALIVGGFFLADRVLSVFATSYGMTGKGDIAALPRCRSSCCR